MRLKNIYICFLLFVLMSTSSIFAQTKYHSRRWRLKFECSNPDSCNVVFPDGTQKKYWYVMYKVRNEMDRDIPWFINIRFIIDKTKKGIPESKVPELFYKGIIPENVDKAKYIDSLRSYSDIDLPLVRRQILKNLKITPKLHPIQEKLLDVLTEHGPSTIDKLIQKTKLSYQEIEEHITKLVINNLAISQETFGSCSFMYGKGDVGYFLVHNQERPVKIGEKLNDWELVSVTNNRALVRQGKNEKVLSQGMGLAYIYSATGKFIFPGNFQQNSGMSTKGIFKGRHRKGDRKYNFEKRIIAKNSTVEGLAIFSDVSPEMDYCAVVVSGLVDPIVRRNKKLYAERELFISAYEQPGDAFHSNLVPIKPLYKKWVIVSTKEINVPKIQKME
ncbi:MAG TPA: hypothetical protein PKM32_06680, partial [Planctomycetota bacterium]|nr:hypothetical protein [Planctomycetota bacterium]